MGRKKRKGRKKGKKKKRGDREMNSWLGVGVGCEWSVVLEKEKDKEQGKMGESATVGNR